jgi:hypothetical protein
VLRRQVHGPIRYRPADRFWLAALLSLLPRHRRSSVFRSPGDAVGLAPQTDRQEVGLHRPTPTRRPPGHRGRAQKFGVAPGAGEPTVGPPQDSGRTGSAGPPDRAVHSLEDPAPGRLRSCPAPHRSELAGVPHQPGRGDHRRGLLPRGHAHRQTAVRARSSSITPVSSTSPASLRTQPRSGRPSRPVTSLAIWAAVPTNPMPCTTSRLTGSSASASSPESSTSTGTSPELQR